MCRVLGVKRNGYYLYCKNQRSSTSDPCHQELVQKVKDISESSDSTYGSRRIKKALIDHNHYISRNKARKLMKEADVQVRNRKKYRVTTDSDHNLPVFDNLINRDFTVSQPDRVYVSDITYLWTQEGWLYLAVVIDLYSRKVVGWSMSSRMKSSLVCDALRMAIWQRRPSPGLIVHSDRGSQYASKAYRHLLQTHNLLGSMSRKGDCWDNAVAESFFGTLKQERIQWRNYQTRHEAQQDVLSYITMFYNSIRLHSYLGYRSPNRYESETLEMKSVA